MFSSKKEEEWKKWLQCYPKVMSLYAAEKKKEKLIKLDDWYVEISVFVICVETIIYLLYNLHNCTFKFKKVFS